MPEDFIKTEILEPPPIDKLAMALSKAQAAIQGAHKDTANPFFKSKYADLGACWDACRKPLADNGLSIIQIPRTESLGATVIVKTILAHSSGQYVDGELTVQNQNKSNPSQGIGSCITYLRRYALCAFVGIAPEDDDGNGASDAKPQPRGNAAGKSNARQYESKQASPPPRQQQSPSDAQLKRLYALTAESTWSADDVKAVMKQKYKVESSKDLSQAQYQEICDALIKETP